MEVFMLIVIIALLSLSVAIQIMTFIKVLSLNPLSLAKKIMTNESGSLIESSVIDDLISYCKEKGLDAFVDTSGERMKLAYQEGDKTVQMIELSFPMTEKGTSEYLSNVEYQKEMIDDFLKNAHI